ncbi:selenide, water dikinase SelD [Magnetofaba australis]|uniref:Selenide, water dikinase n=1 Tax=Magnetofaba australis IT-1 TaxID=1434232 RepID=A0A1Y2K056_9PROT|nr:selenide, water dikinase SelD [Magnetofaba australis]OSM01411.1 putative selenophosphate synthase [Magnetofaba australis IT-1]
MSEIKLTAFSPGSGCGCKISPKDLEEILSGAGAFTAPFEELLVGNDSRDDAAVYDIGGGQAIISTTDFFTPIVNDPFQFGQIASVNAISDVYAMGGEPLMAIGLLGWPLKKLSNDIAKQVVAGARSVCAEVGIPLAGGHSIDISEPIFGLAVTGRVAVDQLKRNDTAQPGAKLFLSKPIGVGILTTAEKKGLVLPQHTTTAVESMTRLNSIGAEFGKMAVVQAMTDVTGFGLLGHLGEMCAGSKVNARIEAAKVPTIDELDFYLEKGSTPGGTDRNWASYGHQVGPISERGKKILCDPQTSGGLLTAVAPEGVDEFLKVAKEAGLELTSFGEILPRGADETGAFIQVVE